MGKVWIVRKHISYEGFDIAGVFASEADAIKLKEAFDDEAEIETVFWDYVTVDAYDVVPAGGL